MRREDEAAADRVAGVVDGEDGRAGGGGVRDIGAPRLQLGGEAQRRVHQLLVAEDEHASVAEVRREARGHAGQRRFEALPVLRCEPVPSAVRQAPRPAEVVEAHQLGALPAGCGQLPALVRGDERLPLLEHPVRQLHRAARRDHQVDARPYVAREFLEPSLVARRAHVDERDDDVVLARVQFVQRADGVQDRVPRGELVVDEDQRAVSREQVRVLGQQQVRGGVRVGLLEAARAGHALDGPARGVQIGREGQTVGDRVPESRRRLGVAEDDRAARRLVAQQFPYPDAEFTPCAPHHGWALRNVLAQHVRHQQVRALGVAPQREPKESGQLPVTCQLDPEPLGDPLP